MHPFSCTNTHHGVTDLGWLKIQKLEYLENGTTFLQNKKDF